MLLENSLYNVDSYHGGHTWVTQYKPRYNPKRFYHNLDLPNTNQGIILSASTTILSYPIQTKV